MSPEAVRLRAQHAAKQKVLRMVSFDQVVRSLHDTLYGNAAIKTPEGLQSEVAKLIMVLSREPELVANPRPALREHLPSWFKNSYQELAGDQWSLDWGPVALDDSSILLALDHLSRVDLTASDRDYLGDALEVMRSTDAKRLGGQFFTDQRITELAVDLLDYSPATHDFLDICAGTGGFLIPAAKRARSVAEAKAVVGVEIDPKIYNLAAATMQRLVGSGITSMFQGDSLLDVYGPMGEILKEGTHHRLASNPPFGAKIKVRSEEILRHYDLARRWSRPGDTWRPQASWTARPPEILFIERNVKLAVPGTGRVALVLPYQILSGPQLGFIRQWLLLHTRIVAVIDLPTEAFQPWTGTKTSILVVERLSKPLASLADVRDTPVFMAISRHVGHDRRGNGTFRDDGSVLEDLSEISAAFTRFTRGEGTDEASVGVFEVSATELARDSELRLNAAFFRPAAASLKTAVAELPGSDFSVAPLGSLVSSVFCPGRFRRNYVQTGGVPFLGGTNITQYSLTTQKALSHNDPHLPDLIVRKGWILVTRSGSTGVVSRVPENWDGLAISEHVIRIVPLDGQESLADFVEAFLRSSWGQSLLNSGIFGSVIDEITPEFIATLPIPVPRNRSTVEEIAVKMRDALLARQVADESLKNADLILRQLLEAHLN